MADQSSSFTGSIPEHYDRGLGPVIFVDYANDLARRVAANTPMHVLEIAAGTGIVTRRLRDVLPAGAQLTATDLNPPMLEVARTKFQKGERVAFQPADATALPFGDAAFDMIVCQFGVMFFPDKDKSYREVYRALEHGGRYIFSVWDSHAHNPYGRVAHEVIGGFLPADPPQFYQVPFGYHRIDPIKASLEAAGFTDIEISIRPAQKDIPDVSAFARGLVYGNPSIDQIKARGTVDPDEIVEAIAAALRREFGGQMPVQAIFFEARKR